jgi:hypothetical protein
MILTNLKSFILKPELKDVMEHSIYKLYVNDSLYLVPLWHNNLWFNGPDGTEIYVMCQPKLPPNITIDEHNNIYYDMCIQINSDLSYLIKKTKCILFDIGGKSFSIPLSDLSLKEEQIYFFKGQGIAQTFTGTGDDHELIYSATNKSDIIVKILLV